MFGKFIFVWIFHLSCTILILKILNFILPIYITNYYFQTADLLLYAFVAKLTIGYSKKLLLAEKVKPNGKAVLITGCARGIGYHLAKRLDSEGFDVFASCRNLDSPGAEDLRKSCSDRLKVIQLEVTNDESVEKAVEFVKNNLGTSDLWAVVNNAGIQKGLLTELTNIQDFRDTFEVNTIGQVRVTKGFLPLLRKSRGRVINMASIAGRLALPITVPYTISKFASIGFSESLRIEMDMWGIRVISIEPDCFETEMTSRDRIMMQYDKVVASAKEELRKDYGAEFLRKFKSIIRQMFRPSTNMSKLMDDIVAAVSLKDPDPVYTTYRNLFYQIVMNFYSICSPDCKVFILNTTARILGLPKIGK